MVCVYLNLCMVKHLKCMSVLPVDASFAEYCSSSLMVMPSVLEVAESRSVTELDNEPVGLGGG